VVVSNMYEYARDCLARTSVRWWRVICMRAHDMSAHEIAICAHNTCSRVLSNMTKMHKHTHAYLHEGAHWHLMRECHCDVDKFSSCVLSHGYRSIEITTLCNLLRDNSSGFFLRIGARACAPTNVTPVHVVRCVCVCQRERESFDFFLRIGARVCAPAN